MTNTPESITCTKNCIKNNIYSYENRIKSTGKISSSYYSVVYAVQHLFYVEVVEDGTEVTGTITANSNNEYAINYTNIVAIPINK